jgi:hypothetical protein
MKVFISSLISGMDATRAAAREAVETLRGQPIMAEDFSATAKSPQVTCLAGLRQADLMLLILGERYGVTQPSGLSATHEEYREAKRLKPVIAFVQQGITPEPSQREFIQEVQAWEGGLFRGGFTTPSELRQGIVRALHDFELSTAVGPVDEVALRRRSVELLPSDSRRSGAPLLTLAVVGGPSQQVLRPAELENTALADAIHQCALFGNSQVFDQSHGVKREIEGDALTLSQERGDRKVVLHQSGEIMLQTAAAVPSDEGRSSAGLPVLIEERVRLQVISAIALVATILEQVDPTQRLTHLAISIRIVGGDYYMWRTMAEHRASPNSGSMGSVDSDRNPVQFFIRRAALSFDTSTLVEDAVVLLRRQWKGVQL